MIKLLSVDGVMRLQDESLESSQDGVTVEQGKI